VTGAVRVTVDHALHPLLLRVGPEPPVQVEPPGIRVQLDPGICRDS
jgi:hypothetical protein